MIDPLTGLTILGGLGNLLGGRSAARKMNEINAQIAERTQREAVRASIKALSGVSMRRRQLDMSVGQQQAQLSRQARVAAGQQRAGAAAAGVEGAAIAATRQDYLRQENLRSAVITKQREFEGQQMQQQSEQIVAQAQARINQAQPQVTPEPNLLGGLLQIGTQALGTYIGNFMPTDGGFRNILTGEGSKTIF